ncbi:glucomannan 4-beta-mannosyltransferase 9-like protein [Tanacetum coccineum]
MNRGFLDSEGRNNNHRKKTTTDTDTCSTSGSDGILNDAIPRVDAAMKVVSPFVGKETVAMKCIVVNTLDVGPNPPLPTHEANSAGNAPGKPSYATTTGKPSGKKVNVRTLFTPGGNGIDVVVLVDSIRAISERFANTAYGFFLGKKVAYPVVASYVRNTWDLQIPLILKKWHPGENLLKEDVSTVPVWDKLHSVPVTAFSEDGLSSIATKLGTPLMFDSYTSDMCIKSWGRSSYARVIIELRADVELNDNTVVPMSKITREGHYTCAGEKKTVKKPRTTNLVNNEANSSGSSFMNIDNDREFASYTPIGEKIDKIERQIFEGKLRLLDNDENSLVHMGIMESDSEVEVVFDKTANLRILMSGKDGSDKGYGNMEMEPDIENMTMSEYLEYKAVKERILWDDVRSKRSPTHYDEADFSYSRQNKSDTFYYPYSHDIPPPPIQSYPKQIYTSSIHTY